MRKYSTKAWAKACSLFVLFVSFVVVLIICVGAASAAERTERPNIVLIVADDLGYAELGCYGQEIIQTPRLDELARQGMRFTQFYSGSAVCAPARCVLMTGKHTGRAAIRNNSQPTRLKELSEKYDWGHPGQVPLPDDEVTLAELLKARGYATAGFGKWGLGHIGTTGEPTRHGFDLFYGYLCQVHAHNHYPRFLWRNDQKELLPGNDDGATGDTYSQDKFTEEALRFVRESAADERPFFLYLPLAIPHLAIQVPEESLAQYEGKIPEEPYEHRTRYHRHPSPRAGYAAMVTHMDRDIGTIVDLIDELGLAENTIILFTSDNGPTFQRLGGADSDFFNSSGPLRGRKGDLYEGGIRVPLIARWPGRIPAGRVSDHTAAFWDFLPTLCEIAGADVPDDIDGLSFVPTLVAHGEQPEHEYLYWEFPAYGHQQVVRAGNWKALRRDMHRGNREWELYDLGNDIGEQNNLADEHPQIVQRLAAISESARVPSSRFPLFPEDAGRRSRDAGAAE